MRRLLKLKFSTGDLQDHFTQFETLIEELSALGSQLSDSDKSVSYTHLYGTLVVICAYCMHHYSEIVGFQLEDS